MGFKFNGRTFVLVLVAFQICALYCVVWETFTAAIRGDPTEMNQEREMGTFVIMSSTFQVLAMTFYSAIIVAAAIQYFSFKKLLVVLVFGFNLVLFLPFNLSGFYLFATSSPPATSINIDITALFLDFYALKGPVPKEIKQIQEDYCCCGLQEYQQESNSTDFCPSMQICRQKEFEGCDVRIPKRMRMLALVTSSIGTGFAIMSMIISPFIYAYFEKDRRLARAEVLRVWQQKAARTIEDRQKALPGLAKTAKKSESGSSSCEEKKTNQSTE